MLSGIIVVYGNHLHYGYISMNQTVQRQNQRLSYFAERDSLTGIPEPAYDYETGCIRGTQGHPGCCVIPDLDDFKLYNDTFGHPGGTHCSRGSRL